MGWRTPQLNEDIVRTHVGRNYSFLSGLQISPAEAGHPPQNFTFNSGIATPEYTQSVLIVATGLTVRNAARTPDRPDD